MDWWYIFIAGSIHACSSGDICVERVKIRALISCFCFRPLVAALTATALTWNDDQSRVFVFYFSEMSLLARRSAKTERDETGEKGCRKVHRSVIWKWAHVMIWANVHGNVVTWMYILKQTTPNPPMGYVKLHGNIWIGDIFLSLVQSTHAALEIFVLRGWRFELWYLVFVLDLWWLHSQQPHWLGTMISQGCLFFIFQRCHCSLAGAPKLSETRQEKKDAAKCTEVWSKYIYICLRDILVNWWSIHR